MMFCSKMNFQVVLLPMAVPRGLSRFNPINDLPSPTFSKCPMKYHTILAQCPIETSAFGVRADMTQHFETVR